MATTTDLPVGVRPETALLIAAAAGAGPNAETLARDISFDIGPGFVVGIEQAAIGVTNLITGASTIEAGVSLDPSAAVIDRNRASYLPVYMHQTVATVGNVPVPGLLQQEYFEYPVFTVQNARFLVNSPQNYSGAQIIFRLYYRIYSVPTDFFVRVAGISLSRG